MRRGGGPSPEELMNKVFVGGLPLHIDKDGFKYFFSCFGPVTDVSAYLVFICARAPICQPQHHI
jgi:RNA recognition motif-containing protein